MEMVKKIGEDDNLDMTKYINYIKSTGFDIVNTTLNHSVAGLVIKDKVYIDLGRLVEHNTPNKVILFIVLHEIAHAKRIAKIGIDEHLVSLTNKNFGEFADYVIKEEIFADRWASIMMYKLLGYEFPRGFTQELDTNKVKADFYKTRLTDTHDMFVKYEDKAFQLLEKEYVK